MNKSRALLIVLLVVPVLSLYSFAIPETAVTRTHLMKDIDQSSITAGVGIELPFKEDSAYLVDWLFGYFGYAPLDWLEFGIAAHTVDLSLYPSVDTKIDVINMFTDSSRLSCLLIGGIGGLPNDLLFYHAGLSLNIRLNQYLQLYLGAGSDSISKALSLQAGTYIAPLRLLGISFNIKLVTGQEGTDLMFSIAPLICFDISSRLETPLAIG